jgi:hypothetical protein
MTVDEDHVVEAVVNDYEKLQVTRNIQMDSEMAAETWNTGHADAGLDADADDNYLVVDIVGNEDVRDVKAVVVVAVVLTVMKMTNAVAREVVAKYVLVIDK